MDYIKSFFKLDLAKGLALCLIIKALVLDVSYPTFLLLIPILGYEAYKLYLKSQAPQKILLDAELRKELENIKSKLSVASMEKATKAQSAGQSRAW